jgi:hypothetical protein
MHPMADPPSIAAVPSKLPSFDMFCGEVLQNNDKDTDECAHPLYRISSQAELSFGT